MAAESWGIFDSFPRDVMTGVIDLDSDTFHMALVDVTSNASDLSASILSELTGELSAGSGYTLEGCPMSGVSVQKTDGWSMFDASNLDFEAAGGNLVFRRGVVFSKSATACALVCQTLFDDSPANITLTDGNTFSCCFSASGIVSFVASALV